MPRTLDHPTLFSSGGVRFHTHSTSLESVSTALSGPDTMSHSNSMDSLLHNSHSKPNSRPTKSKGQGSMVRKHRKDGGKVYDALAESASIMTDFSDTVRVNSDLTQSLNSDRTQSLNSDLTQSLPAKLTRHCKIEMDSSPPPRPSTATATTSTSKHRSNHTGESLGVAPSGKRPQGVEGGVSSEGDDKYCAAAGSEAGEKRAEAEQVGWLGGWGYSWLFRKLNSPILKEVSMQN